MKYKILLLFVVFNLVIFTNNAFAETVSKKTNVSNTPIYVQCGKTTQISFDGYNFTEKNLSYNTTSGNVELIVYERFFFPEKSWLFLKENTNQENAFLIVLDYTFENAILKITPLKKNAEIIILILTRTKNLYALNVKENETEPFYENINMTYKEDYGWW